MKADVVIIGGGVIGASIARELSRYSLKIILIEKEDDVAMGTSKANSGIIHAGYNADFRTLKGRLNIKSNPRFDKLCQDLKVRFKRIGSLVVAFTGEDVKRLRELKKNGEKNGIKSLEIIRGPKLFELEPNLNHKAKYALYAPSAGIISPYKFTIALADNAVINGVKILLETEANNIRIEGRQVCGVVTNRGLIETRTIINAAGLHADEIAKAAGNSFKINPLKGEYQLFDKQWGNLVNHILFPIPTKLSKGILVAPTVHDNLLIGPNSYRVKEKDDLSTTRAGIKEVYEGARKLIPHLPHQDLVNSFAGLRADIEERDDFIIEASRKIKGFINVAGIESPGLSSAPAIAETVSDILKEVIKEISPQLELNYKDDFIENLPEQPRFTDYTNKMEKWQEIVEKDADYGEIICRCEKVSKGEVLGAIYQPVPARSLDAIKRRTRAGMGRCQGGFCSPRVLKILSEELKISPLRITKKGLDSEVLKTETKDMIKETGVKFKDEIRA
ncbi:MAG: NAD(P)/FAD-dependent oxidoreductase [Candidatus Caldatribacteriota bacterium]|nr:NAD(P)/FAD-dependent oxidoreductase [Candidatus Caldatribacteriota bacterium]